MSNRLQMSMPMQTRLAPVSSVNVEARTVELVWSAGGRVKRYDWERGRYYWEELSLEPGAVRLERLNNRAPLLDTHNRWSLSDVIGVVEPGTARVDGRRGVATVRFSKREEVEPIFRDVQDGILANVSVGYAIYRMIETDEMVDGIPVYRAIDWEPMELSLVPIGADMRAGVRSEEVRTFPCEVLLARASDPQPAAIPAASTTKETQMSGKQDERSAGVTTAEKEVPEVTPEQAEQAKREAAAVAAAERKRCADIHELAQRHGIDAEQVRTWIADGTSIDQVRAEVLDLLAKRSEETPTRAAAFVMTVSDETENRRAAMVNAILHRAMPDKEKLTEAGKQWRGYTLRELMRECLELRGVRTRGMSPTQMWERTFQSGSDLPYIILDAANKSLQRAYESTPRTFVPWCRKRYAADFKNINVIQLSGAPSLLEVKSGGEFKRGIVSDGKETYALSTYGRIIGINRQTVINDDMDAFTRLPELCARAAADLESDIVYGILINNPVMADNVQLFNAAHGNVASQAAKISITSLSAGRAAMRKQKGPEGRPINVRPAFLIGPVALETTMEQFTSPNFGAVESEKINEFRQGGRSALTPIAEPRLDDASATAWYLAADPNQIDTIEYAYLEGQEGVYMESRMGFEVDGIELKVRHDFAAKAVDWRGLYKNAGQ